MNTAYRVHTGGLYRCCLATLDDAMNTTYKMVAPKEGDIVTCPHCKDRMIFTNGAWGWFPSPEPGPQ
jgi:hypothetical protein